MNSASTLLTETLGLGQTVCTFVRLSEVEGY